MNRTHLDKEIQFSFPEMQKSALILMTIYITEELYMLKNFFQNLHKLFSIFGPLAKIDLPTSYKFYPGYVGQ